MMNRWYDTIILLSRTQKPLKLAAFVKALKQKTSTVQAPSYSCAKALPSGLRSLTAVFGMGTGITFPQQAPRKWMLYD